MRYVRGRRLTEAARCLAAGEPDILNVALEAGMAHMRRLRERFENNSRSHLKTFVPQAALAISSLWNRFAWIDQC